MQVQNIIIDTDLGDDVDDVLAIAFALLRPELSVKAITGVSYATEKRCHLMRHLLSVTGQPEIPVGAGLKLPLRPASEQERTRLNPVNDYILNHYPAVAEVFRTEEPAEDALALMARTVEEFAPDIGLVSIGPLTNIAAFLCRYPELASKLQFIAMMGGEFERNQREHNIAWDAHAAEIVFNAGVPLFMGTWGVTRRFVINEADCALIKNLGTPLGDFMSRCIEMWWPHKNWKPGPVMYDLAPILWAMDKRYYETQSRRVEVEVQGQHTRGMTVYGHGNPNAEVTVNMLEDEVRELYMRTIGCEV